MAGELLGEVGDAGVDDAVGDAQRCRDARGHAADIDDPAPAPLLHMRDDLTGGADIGHQLDVDVVPPVFIGLLVERRAQRAHRVVDQDIDPPRRLRRRGDEALDVLGLADVGLDRPGLHAMGANLVRRRFQGFRRAPAERDTHAVFRQGERYRLADAPAAAGHQRHPILQSQIHCHASPLCLAAA